MMTIEDALVAYRTYAKAEGKSPKTILADTDVRNAQLKYSPGDRLKI